MVNGKIKPKVVMCEAHREHRCPVCQNTIRPRQRILRFNDKVYDYQTCLDEGQRRYYAERRRKNFGDYPLTTGK